MLKRTVGLTSNRSYFHFYTVCKRSEVKEGDANLYIRELNSLSEMEEKLKLPLLHIDVDYNDCYHISNIAEFLSPCEAFGTYFDVFLSPCEAFGTYVDEILSDCESIGKKFYDDERCPVDEGETGYLLKRQGLPVVREDVRKRNVQHCRHKHKLNGGKKQITFCHLCFLLTGLLPVALPALVEVPNNTVVWQHGSSEAIVVPCKSDYPGPLKWYVKKNPNSGREALYNGYHLRQDAKSYCAVITDEPGKYDLRLKNIADAAQTYICLEPGTLDEASSDLIWIETDPICKDSSTESLVSLTCSIKFRGNWAPAMEWKEHSSHGETVLTFGVKTTTVPNQRVTSTLFMEVQEGKRNYTCTTKFNISGKPNTTTATYVPNYNPVWTSSVFPNSQDESFTKGQSDQDGTKIKLVIGIAATASTILLLALVIVVYRKQKRGGDNRANRVDERPNEGSGANLVPNECNLAYRPT